jgi:hypothetical protein
MTSDENEDPIMSMLVQLPPPARRMARDHQVRARCHAAMARRAGQRAHAEQRRTTLARATDAVLAVSMSLYVVAALVEAVRLAGAR